MAELLQGIVVYGAGAVILGTGLFIAARSRWRHAHAMSEDIGARCVACDGDLVERHSEAWACADCGYEQGPGWERRRQAAHLEGLLALSPEEAKARAHHLLRDARLALLSAGAPLGRPTILQGKGQTERRVLNPDLLDAAQDITQCWQRVQEAGLIDAEVAAALDAAGFSRDATPPDCAGLYELRSAKATASELRPVVARASWQVGKALEELGLST